MEEKLQAAQEMRRTELLDELAELEHKQWKAWALNIIDTEDISPERSARWIALVNTTNKHSRGWHDLSDEMKDKDREWAEQVLWIVKKHMGIR